MITFEQQNGIGILTFQFGEKNILDEASLVSLKDAMLYLSGQGGTLPGLKAVPELSTLLLVSGDPSYFTVGLHPDLYLDQPEDVIRRRVALILDLAESFYSFPHPVLACINGHALGAGGILAMFCDWKFISRKARIGFPEVLLNMNFPSFAAEILRQHVGAQLAKECLYTGKSLKADEALTSGLVDQICEGDQIKQDGLNFLARQRGSRSALMGLKAALRKSNLLLMKELRAFDEESTIQTLLNPDTQEGFRSLKNRTV